MKKTPSLQNAIVSFLYCNHHDSDISNTTTEHGLFEKRYEILKFWILFF